MSDVKTFGLVNGMEIIGTVVGETPEKFILEHALALNIQPGEGPNGAVRLQLIPPTFFSDAAEGGRKGANVDLYKSTIMFSYTLREDILNQYTTQTGKIIIARGSLPK